MSAPDEEINKFYPPSGPDRGLVPEYPFNEVKVSVFGIKQTYHHPKQLNKSFTGSVKSDGSCDYTEFRDKDENTKGYSLSQVHHAMNYASGGTSAMAQGHTENKTMGSGSTMSGGESGQQSKGAVMSGTPAQRIQGHGAFATVATGSEDCTYDFSTGDKSFGCKNFFLNSSGDLAIDAGDSFYTTVAKGECGLHVQDGNYDVKSEKKMQHYSKDEMTIISDVKITLKVGQSTITMTPDSIIIKSNNIKLDAQTDILLTSQQTVTTLTNSGTQLEGGGPTADPSTVSPAGYAGS